MNGWDIALAGLVIASVVLAGLRLIRNRRQGKSGCGCGCSRCAGKCGRARR